MLRRKIVGVIVGLAVSIIGTASVLAQTFTGTITVGTYNDMVSVANNAGAFFNIVGLIVLAIGVFYILYRILKKIGGR